MYLDTTHTIATLPDEIRVSGNIHSIFVHDFWQHIGGKGIYQGKVTLGGKVSMRLHFFNAENPFKKVPFALIEQCLITKKFKNPTTSAICCTKVGTD